MNERIIEQMRRMEDIHGLISVYHNYDDEKIRLLTLEALLRINDPEVLSTFAEALSEDGVEEVRSFAAHALGYMKNNHAVPVLMDALISDPSGQVRSKAAYSLGRLKNPRTLKVLLAALKDAHVAVRRNAAQALGMLGDQRAEKSLMELMEHELDLNVRCNIAKALGKLKSTQSIALLEKILISDPQQKAVKSAMEGLGWIGNQQCFDILKAFQQSKQKSSLDTELNMIIEKLENMLLKPENEIEDIPKYAPLMNREQVDYKKILDRLNKLGDEN
jgi:HEAT repeat protein